MGVPDIQHFLISMFVLIISITAHEFAHAKAAYLAGDDTAERAGRISINPLDHLDVMGTIMMVISSLAHFGIGWAKPVPVNPAKFDNPRWDSLKISLWGPLSNLLLALIAGQGIRFGWHYLSSTDLYILFLFVSINIALALFNLIPIAPLDGSHIFSAILPVEMARNYDMFMARYGFLVLLGVIFLLPSALPTLLGPPRNALFMLFTGLPPL
ncbi:MAG: site-2 protease family protein [Armatimonadetes bacterium]|nr:site-2 protease family protein [Armatimonadota bacterium]